MKTPLKKLHLQKTQSLKHYVQNGDVQGRN